MIEKNLTIVYALSFMDLLAVGLIFPVFYGHVRNLGGSSFFIGVLGSTYSTIQVLSGPIVGSWSDIRGRKRILITTLLLCSLCYFALGITSSLTFILLLRILLSLVKHTQTLCKAYVADIIPKEQHAAVLGQSAAYGTIGFVVGPIIGGHLSEYEHGFFYITTLTAGLFLINIALAMQMRPSKSSTKAPQSETVIRTILNEFVKIKTELTKTNWAVFWDAFLLRFFFGLSISIYFSNQALFIQDKFQLSQKDIGYIISFVSLIGVITGFYLGQIKDKFYKNDANCLNRLLHGFAIFAVCFIGLSTAPKFYLFLLFLVPFAVVSIILRNVSMELIIQKSDASEKGSLSGASNSLMSVARSVSPVIVGAITTKFGDESVMMVAFMPSFLGALLCLALRYKRRRVHVD